MAKHKVIVLRVSGSAELGVEAQTSAAALAAALEMPVLFGAPQHRCVAVLPQHIGNGCSLEPEHIGSRS